MILFFRFFANHLISSHLGLERNAIEKETNLQVIHRILVSFRFYSKMIPKVGFFFSFLSLASLTREKRRQGGFVRSGVVVSKIVCLFLQLDLEATAAGGDVFQVK